MYLLFRLLSLCLSLSLLNSYAFSFNTNQEDMVQQIRLIRQHFKVGYAPVEWKKEHHGWDLEEVFDEAILHVLNEPPLSTKQFQGLLKKLLDTTQDHHVGILFCSTEKGTLPFTVKGVNERYFIDWIDSKRLSSSFFNIKIGDELLEFDGKPITEIIEEIKRENCAHSNPRTAQSFAELKLTARSGAVGDEVLAGPVVIKAKSAIGKEFLFQLRWDYTPEHINDLTFAESLVSFGYIPDFSEKTIGNFPQLMMANPLHLYYANEMTSHKGGLGARKSFVPNLGSPLFGQAGFLNLKDPMPNSDFWYAYAYRNAIGHTIGYIRIPHYSLTKKEVEEFEGLISWMENHTDALVIDQLNNFGGSAMELYQIAALLTPFPLQTPLHRIKVTQKEAFSAYKKLRLFEDLERTRQFIQDFDEENEQGENYDHQGELVYKDYLAHLLNEWNAGHYLTSPIHILSVDTINPNPRCHYTKPILMLINEMDFSGGDFMAAIMQDNGRAALFGERTGGAGGMVKRFSFPNNYGILRCSYTSSIAERVDGKKIEDLGVRPDIEYQISINDLQDNFSEYVSAVNRSIEELIKKNEDQTAARVEMVSQVGEEG